MKLQEASRKEISRIALGTLAYDGIMIVTLFVFSLLGIGSFDLGRILFSASMGSLIAITCFIILCLTIQDAVEMENKKKMKARFQRSYFIRMVLQSGWVVSCFFFKPIHFVAGALPILFPNAVIYYLHATGKLMPANEATPAADTVSEEDASGKEVYDEDAAEEEDPADTEETES